MNRDVHIAALRAAARVAFSMALPVALVSGCSAADNSNGEQSASTDDALKSSGKKTTPPPADPCEDDASAAAPTCDTILASAFPGQDKYQWQPVAQPADVVACCDTELKTNAAGGKYRWSCCVAYDPATVDVDAGETPHTNMNHVMACTPWGPPVPPSMNRRRGRGRRANPEIAMWIAKAVA